MMCFTVLAFYCLYLYISQVN